MSVCSEIFSDFNKVGIFKVIIFFILLVMFHNFMMKTCRTDANWLYLIIHAELIRKNHVEM